LIIEADNSLRTLCIDESGAPMGQGQPLPVANRLPALAGFLPIKATSAVPDLYEGNRYYFATNHGAVYMTDCEHPPVLIGKGPWFMEGVGRLATTADTGYQALYWASYSRFLRTVIP
jgi:hypothetical protein